VRRRLPLLPQSDIAKVLNQDGGGPRATSVYNRYADDKEKGLAMETWDRVLTSILESAKATSKVSRCGRRATRHHRCRVLASQTHTALQRLREALMRGW
jgi:hypothetical protein